MLLYLKGGPRDNDLLDTGPVVPVNGVLKVAHCDKPEPVSLFDMVKGSSKEIKYRIILYKKTDKMRFYLPLQLDIPIYEFWSQ